MMPASKCSRLLQFNFTCAILQLTNNEREKIMAYVFQEKKANLAPTIKAILKKYNVKGTSVRNHSSLVLNIKSGKMDFVENFIKTDAATRHGNKMDQKQID